MKEALAQLVIELKDKVSEGLNKIENGYKSLKAHVVAIGVAMAAVGAIVMQSIQAYGEQEEASRRLDNALGNMGLAGTGASDRLQKLATQLSKTTIYADENIVSMQALLAGYGQNESAIAKLTPKILDLASFLKIDLQSAATMVGKTLANETTTALTRSGIAIDESAFKTDALGAVLKGLSGNFRDLSTEIGGTTIGQIQIMKNEWGEVLEALGKILAGPAKIVIQWLTDLSGYLVQNQIYFQDFINIIFYLGESVANTFIFMGEIIGTWYAGVWGIIQGMGQLVQGDFAGAYNTMKNISQTTFNSLGADFAKLVANQKAAYTKMKAEDKIKTDEEKAAEILKYKGRQTQNAADLQEEKDKNAKLLKERIDQDTKIKKEVREYNIEQEKEQARTDKEKILSLQGTFSTIATLQGSHNKALFIAGKAAAIANAIINTAEGISKAWSYGPILGIIFSALIAAAGAIQISKISATGMAQGGIVMPTEGGTLARIGEAGYPEAVIPLNDERVGGMLGNNVTVNINAGVVVADEESLRALAERIDEKLYALRSNNQTVSI
jgi:hypothetical protein